MCSFGLALLLAVAPAHGSEGRAQRLLRMQAEVQSLVAEGTPLMGRLQELVPRYPSADADELADLAAERGRISFRLRPIHLRLVVLDKEYEAEERSYELEQGSKVLSQLRRKGAESPPEKVIGDFFALETFNQAHGDFFRRLGALLADDDRTFAAAQKAARAGRRSTALAAGGVLGGACLLALALLARRQGAAVCLLVAAASHAAAASPPTEPKAAAAERAIRAELAALRPAVEHVEALAREGSGDGREEPRARVQAGLKSLEEHGRHLSRLRHDLRGPGGRAFSPASSSRVAQAMLLSQLDYDVQALLRRAEGALRSEEAAFNAGQARRRSRRLMAGAFAAAVGLALTAAVIAAAPARPGPSPRRPRLALETPSGSPPPAGVGRYRILRELGSGSLGTVYEAVADDEGGKVAVKRLRPELHRGAQDVERLLAHARAAARLEHPNIVKVHDVILQDQRVHLVMELLDGDMLDGLLADGPLPPDRVKSVFRQVCPALDHIHRAGLVHGDIRPSNIMLTGHRVVKLMDAYLVGEDLAPAADLYALGALLEELTGGAPLESYASALELMDAVEELPG